MNNAIAAQCERRACNFGNESFKASPFVLLDLENEEQI